MSAQREIEIEKVFDTAGAFKAVDEARDWLKANGFSFGSMQAGAPTAIYRGDCIISKWRNLSREEQRTCDGLMTGDFRNGPVKVVIFKSQN